MKNVGLKMLDWADIPTENDIDQMATCWFSLVFSTAGLVAPTIHGIVNDGDTIDYWPVQNLNIMLADGQQRYTRWCPKQPIDH